MSERRVTWPHHCPTWDSPGGCRCVISTADDILEALVEKAAAAVAEADYAAGRGILNRPDARFLARAVLAAVWPDLPAARPVVDRDALAEAVKDVCWKATQYGETEDGDTLAYLVPKGAMHRLIGAAQAAGIPAAFRSKETSDG